jgi:hypothetical protein
VVIDLFEEGQSQTVNYLKLKELLICLGLITEAAANADSVERALLYDLWKLLKGEEQEEVALDDVKLAVIGILRMTHKRLGVDKKYGALSFSKEEVSRMQSSFNVFYLNRLHHVGKMSELQKQQKALVDQHQFKPELNQKSTAIA